MEPLHNKSTWPKPNRNLEAALGRFIIAWNILEQQINFAIQEACRLEFDIGMSITVNLGTKAKLDIFQSIIHSLGEALSPGLLETVDKLVADTGNASGELRNFIVHGQPFQVRLPRKEISVWAKLSARKGGVRGYFSRLSTASVDNQTDQVKELIDRWVKARETLADDIEIIEMMERA